MTRHDETLQDKARRHAERVLRRAVADEIGRRVTVARVRGVDATCPAIVRPGLSIRWAPEAWTQLIKIREARR